MPYVQYLEVPTYELSRNMSWVFYIVSLKGDLEMVTDYANWVKYPTIFKFVINWKQKMKLLRNVGAILRGTHVKHHAKVN